jgi:hypothetical protein
LLPSGRAISTTMTSSAATGTAPECGGVGSSMGSVDTSLHRPAAISNCAIWLQNEAKMISVVATL